MHQAPAVQVRCPGSPAWRAARTALPAATVSVVSAWSLLMLGWPSRLAWAIAFGVAVIAATVAWHRTREAVWWITWSGRHWDLASEARGGGVQESTPVGTIDLMIDLGSWLLLRARPETGVSRWVAVGWRHTRPEHRALCTALYAQRSRSTMPTALPDQPPR